MFWPSSSRPSSATKEREPSSSRHRRSASDLAHLIHSKREAPSVLDLQSMVRLSGKSSLYLPAEYAPCALILPTCIRATAQYVAQHANTRGLFRIPGSIKVVGAIFDYYCHMDKGDDISGTVRSATLPLHIQYSVHDIASALKRLLSTLPGGILGSLLLFDSFIAVQSQLNSEPEFPRTNQTKVRARLLALAIGTIESQFRRELICAIFGLLSMIGRMAELTPREDENGLPLPTTDLMGYGALAICFGPLLVGDLLEAYTMKLAAPGSGMIVLPPATQQIRKDTRRHKPGNATTTTPKNVQPAVDKILIANRVTEMLISNWRDIVRQMKSLGTHRKRHASGGSFSRPQLRPSTSETFLTTELPKDFSQLRPTSAIITTRSNADQLNLDNLLPSSPTLSKQATSSKRASGFLRPKASVNTLSPMVEESPQPMSRNNNSAIMEEADHEPYAQEGTPLAEASGSPTGKKQLAVPPRLSSMDSSRAMEDKENISGVETKAPSLEQNNHERPNSGDDTPPQFYHSRSSAAAAPKTPNSKKQDSRRESVENSNVLEPRIIPARQGAQSPATDPRYQLRRYKRKENPALVGSPLRGIDGLHPGRMEAESGTKRLRRTKSGPMRNAIARKEDDVFSPKSAYSAPVAVWKNGVQQKSPMAKVLRSSMSDGVSLRASAIRSLINAGKSRMRNSNANYDKKQMWDLVAGDVDPWEVCSQSAPFEDGKPKSIIQHLNLHHGYNLSPDRIEDSEAMTALYQVIISLHDRLMKQQLETEMLQRERSSPPTEETTSQLLQDVGAWRRRAESAEKRIQVFERFTERLKGIRDAAMASDEPEVVDDKEAAAADGGDGGSVPDKLKQDRNSVSAAARVRFAEVDDKEGEETSAGGGGGGGQEKKMEGQRTSQDSSGSRGLTHGGGRSQSLDNGRMGKDDGVKGVEGVGLRPRPASFDEVAELWMAAKELLDLDKKNEGEEEEK